MDGVIGHEFGGHRLTGASALRAPLMMPMITGNTNICPIDGPAVTNRDKHQAEQENDTTQKRTVLAKALPPHRASSAS
jgi:hypothetical protein